MTAERGSGLGISLTVSLRLQGKPHLTLSSFKMPPTSSVGGQNDCGRPQSTTPASLMLGTPHPSLQWGKGTPRDENSFWIHLRDVTG